jgi:hypothetical protein
MEEMNNMVPELKRDPQGFTRIGRIGFADSSVAEARRMAAWAAEHGGFHDFADEHCVDCATPGECGRGIYRDLIFDAEKAYAEAGLGLLADRVERLHSGTLKAWARFDKANATTDV